MNRRGLALKLLGIPVIAVMAAACSPKKTEEQRTPETMATYEELQSLTAELQAEIAALMEESKEGDAASIVIPPGLFLRGLPQGSGTAEDPFLIYTEADLRAVSSTHFAKSHYRLMADITLTGDNDSDPGNGNWTPIGGSEGFFGVFDGGGHTITGLRINVPDNFPVYTSAGMFGSIDTNSRVENLGLIDVSITAGTQGIGGIAGVNYGTIQNCFVTGSIGDTITKGGIAGSNTRDGTIRNCYFAGRVFHRREGVSPVSGGIAGVSGGVVSNCVSLAESVTEEPQTAAGRVIGENRISEWDGTLVNNYGWSGTTTGQTYLYYVAVPSSSDPAGKDGADLTAAELKTRAAWERAGFSFGANSVWVWNGANGMPSLRNQMVVVPWPAYLENPAIAVPSPNMDETGY